MTNRRDVHSAARRGAEVDKAKAVKTSSSRLWRPVIGVGIALAIAFVFLVAFFPPG